MGVPDIEEEMCEIYEIELSMSTISIITYKVNQTVQEWQNCPLDPVYLIVWMDGIVFKVRDNGKIINKTVFFYVDLKFDDYGHYLEAMNAVRPLVDELTVMGEYKSYC